jgi:hypothetical protein
MASFSVPGLKGAGNYIYHFMWGGYRDCVDVNVRTTTVANRYGIYNTSAANTWVRLDHCEFYFVLNPVTTCTKIGTTRSVQTCLTACQSAGNGCKGVQVARYSNPSGTLPYTPGVPLLWFNITQLDETTAPYTTTGRCGDPSIHGRAKAGCDIVSPRCNATKLAAAADDYICFGLTPYRDQNLQASEDYILTSDSADPRFYSSCWLKVPNGGFLNVPAYEQPLTKWDVGDKCVDCTYRDSARTAGTNIAADWATQLSSQCINCDNPNL